MTDFRAFGLREPVQRALDDAGFESPTPIQQKAVPILLAGQDLIGVAETGTGKTLAYLLPIFQRLELHEPGPQAVVICPTRELAIQVAGEAERFGSRLGARCAVAYGGTSSGEQKRALVEGCHLLVATPGRLLDFVTSAWLSLRKVRCLVLDEADRMLDMGFINDVDAILRRAPMSRQTMLFSATFPDELQQLSRRYMFHPRFVRMHTGTRVAHKVDHAIYPVAGEQKADLLVEILRRENPTKALIFTATREGTSELALRLRRRNYEVLSLSSLLSQANRERALEAFRSGEYRLLVATDVAARGLDITDIDLVVNFDVPMHAEDYVHRLGRTGRMERAGRAVTLVTGRDDRRVEEIEKLLGEEVPRLRLKGFPYKPLRRGSGSGRRRAAAARRGAARRSSGRSRAETARRAKTRSDRADRGDRTEADASAGPKRRTRRRSIPRGKRGSKS